MIETKARGRRVGSKHYPPEFRAQVVAETRDPNRPIAEVAHSHGLNANLVSMWPSRKMGTGVAIRSASPRNVSTGAN
ncbi:transposase [Paraburkholderia xenovorans]